MKRRFAVVLIFLLAISVSGCAGRAAKEQPKENQNEISSDQKAPEDKGASQENEPEAEKEKSITLEDIRNANTPTNLLNNHSIVIYEASQYANEDVEDGYLGFDNSCLENVENGIRYFSSAASQSVPFNTLIEKNAEGNYIEKTQFAGESTVETSFDSENDMFETLNKLWYFGSEQFAAEKIVDIGEREGNIVVLTERVPGGEEFGRDIIKREYLVNADSYELIGIVETMPTDSVYGVVVTYTNVTYDKEPAFSTELVDIEEQNGPTSEDYEMMNSPDDGEE